MNKNSILFIGLDTHKDFFEVAYFSPEQHQAVEHYGRISSSKVSLTKFVQSMQRKYPQSTLHVVYEAGPCGYWVYRHLTKLGHECFIVAPSLIPKKPGDRVKTDKRDAILLCTLLKNGDANPIYVPEPEDEAVRDLSRARERAMFDLNDARYQMKAMLLRNNIHYDGTANWSLKHLRWLTEMVLPHPSQQLVFQEMLMTINERIARLQRLDNELEHHVRQWRYYPVVKSIQALKGVRLLVATGVIAELGDLTRFDHPSKLMSYVGLVPSEHSSGGKRKLGSITKCGNTRARRLLIEGASSYRYSANVSKELQVRQEGLPKQVVDIAWKAQLRLCRRYQRLIARGKNSNVVKVAIAREMVAFIWSISREIVLSKVDIKNRLARVPA
jgi:transposase